jgi:hypothetical protein
MHTQLHAAALGLLLATGQMNEHAPAVVLEAVQPVAQLQLVPAAFSC